MTQEMHDTAARTAGRRARQLRKAGLKVSTGSLGMQVTSVGRVRLTLLTIHDTGMVSIPEPQENGRPVRF